MPTRRIFAAVLIGLVLRAVVSLHPVAWLAWFAPIPLLWLALRCSPGQAAKVTFLAALIGQSANFHYFRTVMPLHSALLAMVGISLTWVLVVCGARRIVLRYQSWWTIFAYPVLCVAVDTLAAHLLPDGNWGSLAYSQVKVLSLLQVTSLFGLAGLTFLLALVPSTMAIDLFLDTKLRHVRLAYGVTALLVVASFAYGALRLRTPLRGTPTTFGMVAIDDAIGMKASPGYIASIWQSYDRQVAALAAQGAQIIVLPEKIGEIDSTHAREWQQHLSQLAAQNHVWIASGVGVTDATSDGKTRKLNLEWLFTPQGGLSASYQKHHLAPPERDNLPGFAYDVRSINGSNYGLAICKDMHFADMGRAYAQRDAAAMLVPAWDFGADGWLAARMTLTRGVESGFSVIRSSREGMLTVSDPYGRVIAERASAPMPGASLLVRTTVTAPVSTLYARTGDLFGWLCVAISALLLCVERVTRKRVSRTRQDKASLAGVSA